jgi:transcriptional regulator with XRE-family HTH domain
LHEGVGGEYGPRVTDPRGAAEAPLDPEIVALGKVIARLREDRGLSQADLAARVGISQPTLSRFERGAGKPDALTMKKLAAELGVSVDAVNNRIDEVLAQAKKLSANVTQRSTGQDGWWDTAVALLGAIGVVALIVVAVAAVFGGSKAGGGSSS